MNDVTAFSPQDGLREMQEQFRAKYDVLRVIGRGGSGLVLEARHLRLRQHVAIKVLLPSALDSVPSVTRFEREARAAAKLTSQHVVRVLDVDVLDNGRSYLVMEFLEGRDLAEELKERGHIPMTEAVDMVLEACSGVADAHAHGIIHRDLKPSNLFLAKRDRGGRTLKVLDFGISLMAADLDDRVTITQVMLGSPSYMSPEQLRSARDVDARSDVWALGVILYKLLAGVAPFSGTTTTAVASAIAADPPTPISDYVDVPDGLWRVIERALQKRPADRYASVEELASALKPFATPRSRTSSFPSIVRLLRGEARDSGSMPTARFTRGRGSRPEIKEVPKIISVPPAPPSAPPTLSTPVVTEGAATPTATPRSPSEPTAAPVETAGEATIEKSWASGTQRLPAFRQRPWKAAASVAILAVAAGLVAWVAGRDGGDRSSGVAAAPASASVAAEPARPAQDASASAAAQQPPAPSAPLTTPEDLPRREKDAKDKAKKTTAPATPPRGTGQPQPRGNPLFL